MKKVILTAEQLVNLRNNVIISEALVAEESAPLADSGVSTDYNQFAMQNIAKEPESEVTQDEIKESDIYGEITKGLYNYAQQYDIAEKVAAEITKSDARISTPTAKQFIDKLLYGLYRMSSDPSQNEAYERLLRIIGVNLDAKIVTKDNTLQ